MQHNPEKGNARAGQRRALYKSKQYLSSRNRLNFTVINYGAMVVLPTLLSRLLPDGKQIGHHWVARNPRRADHHAGSFKINMRNGKWADFATADRGGDIISLVAYLAGINQGEAARRILSMLGGVHHD